MEELVKKIEELGLFKHVDFSVGNLYLYPFGNLEDEIVLYYRRNSGICLVDINNPGTTGMSQFQPLVDDLDGRTFDSFEDFSKELLEILEGV